MLIPGHENLLSDRSRTWQLFWNRSRTLCPLSLELCTLVQVVMHTVHTDLQSPTCLSPKLSLPVCTPKPNLADTNCACGTAGLPQRSWTPSYTAPSHSTSWRLVTTWNRFRLLFQLSSVRFSPSPASVHYWLFVHLPWLEEAHKYVLVPARPRWMTLESDYTICVTTAAEGLHLLPKRTYLSPLYNAKPLVG